MTGDPRRGRWAFDAVADIYGDARPAYPSALFDVLFAELPDNPRLVEVGPGTGQATVDLVSRGAHVTAVELGPNLADRIAKRFERSSVEVVNASFEAAVLPTGHFDAVVSATAYHWVDETQRIERPRVLLKPGGCLAIIDLIQVHSAADCGYFDHVQPIYQRYGSAKPNDAPTSHADAKPRIAAQIAASALFDEPTITRIAWDQTYTTDQYRQLLLTYSGTQLMQEPDRSEMVDALVGVIDTKFGGTITRPLAATLTLARVRR